MTKTNLQIALQYWQRIMGLTEWTITARWGTPEELRGEPPELSACGMCMWNPTTKTAEIVLDRKQRDIEGTLIHELAHLLLHGHKPPCGTAYTPNQEAICDQIAAMLQRVLREGA